MIATPEAPPSLTDWVWQPRADRELRLPSGRGDWIGTPYDELADDVRRAAQCAVEFGLSNERVVLTLSSPRDVVVWVYALLLSGSTVVVAPSPSLAGGDRQLGELLARYQTRFDIKHAVVDGDCRARQAAAGLLRVVGARDFEHFSPVDVDRRTAVAMIQPSSGSTGAPKGILLGRAGIEQNVASITRWLDLVEGDTCASWLPMHHDMGLIGTIFGPVTLQLDLFLMRPEQFIRSPMTWLRLFGERGATVTASPPFALEHVMRRVSRADLKACDFAQWRVLIVGAERLAERVLQRFCRGLAPYGFSQAAIVPAYGLGECTLAVAGVAPGTALVSAERPEGIRVGPECVVSSGRPLDGIEVQILDSGHPVADGIVGEIVVKSPSLALGYVDPDDHFRVENGWLRTGDSGYMRDGELFVLGRFGDAIKIRGQWLFPETIEEVVVDALGGDVRPVALLDEETRSGRCIVLVPPKTSPESVAAVKRAAEQAAPGLEVHIVGVARKDMLWTTSGKPRRREMWARHRDVGQCGIELQP
jgi:acyl-CoA synthetase (AMP-forming)/AMP-acid ligase II